MLAIVVHPSFLLPARSARVRIVPACLRLDATMPSHEVRPLIGAPRLGVEIMRRVSHRPNTGPDRTRRGIRTIDSRAGQNHVGPDALRSMTSKDLDPLTVSDLRGTLAGQQLGVTRMHLHMPNHSLRTPNKTSTRSMSKPRASDEQWAVI